MATPSWIQFSITELAAGQLIERALPLLKSEHFSLTELYPLVQTEDGVECGTDRYPCRQESSALELARDWKGFALVYWIPRLKTNIFLNFWAEDKKTSFAVEITQQTLFHTSREFNEGEWLQDFLCNLTTKLQTSACLYGDDERMYAPLEPEELSKELRNGLLSRLPGPFFCMILQSYINDTEAKRVQSMLSSHSSASYFKTRNHYHVFSGLVPRVRISPS